MVRGDIAERQRDIYSDIIGLMLGANHEMGRELLWQGYPTDSRGTPFQKFWQRLDDRDDIAPIHQWQATRLGKQPASTETAASVSSSNPGRVQED